jgi:hypothetical protein
MTGLIRTAELWWQCYCLTHLALAATSDLTPLSDVTFGNSNPSNGGGVANSQHVGEEGYMLAQAWMCLLGVPKGKKAKGKPWV